MFLFDWHDPDGGPSEHKSACGARLAVLIHRGPKHLFDRFSILERGDICCGRSKSSPSLVAALVCNPDGHLRILSF